MQPTPWAHSNVPSLKFLCTLELAKHTSDKSAKAETNLFDDGIKKLCTELQKYVEFIENCIHSTQSDEKYSREYLINYGLRNHPEITSNYLARENLYQSKTDLNKKITQQILFSACTKGILDEPLLQDLFALNPQLNLNNGVYTPLIGASAVGNLKIIKLLMANGATIPSVASQTAWETPVFAVCTAQLRDSHKNVLRFLIENRAIFDNINHEGDTPLSYLCFRMSLSEEYSIESYLELIELLLQNGANVNHQGRNGISLLMMAATHKNPILLKTILKYNPDLEGVDSSNRTAFIIAVRNKNLDTLYLLKKAGANINHNPNGSANSALTCAAHLDNTELIRTLLLMGANTEIQDPKHQTALIIAIQKGNLEMAQVLLAYGAKVDVTDKSDASPLRIALEKENFPLVAQLLSYTDKIHTDFKLSTAFSSLLKLVKSNRVDVLQQMLNKGLFKIFEKESPSWRRLLSDNATPAMKKLLTNYRNSEYKQSPWYKKLQFEVKRLAQDRPLTVIAAGGVATVAIGAGLWYTFKHKENRSLSLLH